MFVLGKSVRIFGLAYLLLVAVAQAQFNYTVSNNAVTITGYTGSGGSVVIPSTINSLPVVAIGSVAFQNITTITSVTIPNSVTSIGSYAFYNCSSLTSVTIPNSVTSIGNYAFDSCTSLTGITIPSSVTSIGDSVFYGCTRLASVTIPNSVTSIGSYAFESCSSLTSVTIPNSVTSIGSLAFYQCTSLTSITIPNSVTSIELSTFYGCTRLASVTIPNSVTSIGDFAFYGCTSLTSVTIPNSVTSIGGNAFYGCTRLASVTIPNSVAAIGGSAFYQCTSLTSITIPNSVTYIGLGAFRYCSSLASATFQGDAPYMQPDVFMSTASSFTIYYYWSAANFNSPYWLAYKAAKALGYSTANNQVTITGYGGSGGVVSIPGTINALPVTAIGSHAFQNISTITRVTIPNSVTSIGDFAFYGCTSLTSVLFEGNAPSMGLGVFSNGISAPASGFMVYYKNTANGFNSPNWTTSAGETYPAYSYFSTPASSWLAAHGLPPYTDLQSSPNHDGVTLLMAYAFNLDPTKNQSNRLPRPTLDTNNLGLTFYAGSPGITYTVERSTDLINWTTTGITLSGLDANLFRTATLPLSAGPTGFLRLNVGF